MTLENNQLNRTVIQGIRGIICIITLCFVGSVCFGQIQKGDADNPSGIDKSAQLRGFGALEAATNINNTYQFLKNTNDSLTKASQALLMNRGVLVREMLKTVNGYRSLGLFVPLKIEYLLDSLEEVGLNDLAKSVVQSRNTKEKIQSLKALGLFYFENERRGDSVYIQRIEAELEELEYKFPSYEVGISGGFGYGFNPVAEGGLVFGWVKPRNKILGERFSMSTLVIGGEIIPNRNVSGFSIGYKASVIGSFFGGFTFVPLGFGQSIDSVTLQTTSWFTGAFFRPEIGYWNQFFSLSVGANIPYISSRVGGELRSRYNRAVNPFQVSLRFHLLTQLKFMQKSPSHQRRRYYEGLIR